MIETAPPTALPPALPAASAVRTVEPALFGKLVALYGGGGFIGRSVAEALLRAGARVRIIQRHPERAFEVRALANLGQLQFVAADVERDVIAARAAQDVDAVVNLIGHFGGDLERNTVGTARAIAEAAAARGIPMVHVSATAADETGEAAYARAKGRAERAVKEAHPAATILRPSTVFGRDDQFINRFAGLIARLKLLPIIRSDVRFQPVFVGDVAAAVAVALGDPGQHGGKTYTLGGPQTLSMRKLHEWLAGQIGRKAHFVDVPDAAAAAGVKAFGWLPGAPITQDQFTLLQRDSVVPEGAAGFAELGIAPVALESVAAGWLERYRPTGRFARKVTAAA